MESYFYAFRNSVLGFNLPLRTKQGLTLANAHNVLAFSISVIKDLSSFW